MNPETGHLVRQEKLRELKAELQASYEPLPQELEGPARKKLKRAAEAHVARHSGGKLSKWAAAKRKERRRMEKETRRRQRGRR